MQLEKKLIKYITTWFNGTLAPEPINTEDDIVPQIQEIMYDFISDFFYDLENQK